MHNVGDLSVEKVKFTDGPEGPQIGVTQIMDTINAGESRTASVEWDARRQDSQLAERRREEFEGRPRLRGPTDG